MLVLTNEILKQSVFSLDKFLIRGVFNLNGGVILLTLVSLESGSSSQRNGSLMVFPNRVSETESSLLRAGYFGSMLLLGATERIEAAILSIRIFEFFLKF